VQSCFYLFLLFFLNSVVIKTFTKTQRLPFWCLKNITKNMYWNTVCFLMKNHLELINHWRIHPAHELISNWKYASLIWTLSYDWCQIGLLRQNWEDFSIQLHQGGQSLKSFWCHIQFSHTGCHFLWTALNWFKSENFKLKKHTGWLCRNDPSVRNIAMEQITWWIDLFWLWYKWLLMLYAMYWLADAQKVNRS